MFEAGHKSEPDACWKRIFVRYVFFLFLLSIELFNYFATVFYNNAPYKSKKNETQMFQKYYFKNTRRIMSYGCNTKQFVGCTNLVEL